MRCLKTTHEAMITESRVSNGKNRCGGPDFTSRASGNSQQGKPGNPDYHGVLENQLGERGVGRAGGFSGQ